MVTKKQPNIITKSVWVILKEDKLAYAPTQNDLIATFKSKEGAEKEMEHADLKNCRVAEAIIAYIPE